MGARETRTTVTVEGKNKDQYLHNLQSAFHKLSVVLGTNGVFDARLAEYTKRIAALADVLRYKDEQEAPEDNTGVYSELTIDKRGGFPSLDDLIVFSSEVETADDILSKLSPPSSYIDEAKELLLNAEASGSNKSRLNEINETLRRINFCHRVEHRDFAYLPEGTKTRLQHIDLIGEDKSVENFSVFYAGWDMAKHFFAIHTLKLDDDKGSKFMGMGSKKGHIYKQGKKWVPTEAVQNALYSSLGMHPLHYFTEFNKLEGIHPIEVSYLGIDMFETVHVAQNFDDILKTHPDSAVLVANAILLKANGTTGSGETRQSTYEVKDALASMYIICSDDIKPAVMDWYKHSKYVDYEILSF